MEVLKFHSFQTQNVYQSPTKHLSQARAYVLQTVVCSAIYFQPLISKDWVWVGKRFYCSGRNSCSFICFCVVHRPRQSQVQSLPSQSSPTWTFLWCLILPSLKFIFPGFHGFSFLQVAYSLSLIIFSWLLSLDDSFKCGHLSRSCPQLLSSCLLSLSDFIYSHHLLSSSRQLPAFLFAKLQCYMSISFSSLPWDINRVQSIPNQTHYRFLLTAHTCSTS